MAYSDQYLSDYRFSASQIKSWMSCQRLFGWTYLAGIRGAPSASQSLGSEVHARIENHLKTGEPIDLTDDVGAVIETGLDMIPPLDRNQKIEAEFVHQGRHKWLGYKDLEWGPNVWDWKTTKNIKYALTEEQLAYDPQAVLYAVSNGNPSVFLNWCYFPTDKKTAKGKKVHLKVTYEHAQKCFEELERIADSAFEVAKGAKGLDGEALRDYVLSLPYNVHQCEAYGGCPHRGLCNLSPDERFRASMTQANGKVNHHMSLFDRLQKQNQKEDAKPAEPPAAPVAINPPEATAPPAPVVPEPAPTEPAMPKAKKAKPASAAAPTAPAGGFTLYVNCTPVGVSVNSFDHLLSEARKRIEKELEIADYRFAEYGQGPGILLKTVEQLLSEQVVTEFTVDTRSPETQICLSLLKSRAGRIVLGF